MKIITLMEDEPGTVPGICARHGLSFAIITDKHNILMDTGASPQTWENAAVLGIDPKKIDTVVISHGHYDHTGGLLSFAKINPKATIYIHKKAFGAFYHDESYIGADPEIRHLDNLVQVDDTFVIDEELMLFSGFNGRRLWPDGNRLLSVKIGEGRVQDSFDHEQCLVVRENGKTALFSGCAHNGILNILDRYGELEPAEPDYCFSGFHMMRKDGYSQEDVEGMRATANELLKTSTIYYTGHCTGEKALEVMKPILGTKLKRFRAGDRFEIT